MDFAVLHEVLHTMGFVPACAPHHTRSGHVSDDPRDLMYAGDEPWRPSVLDVGQDDYYHAHRLGCLELAVSPYLERNIEQHPMERLAVAVVGPGRVVSTPAGIRCKPRCSTTFRRGTKVVLRAVPANGRTSRPLERRVQGLEELHGYDERPSCGARALQAVALTHERERPARRGADLNP